MSLLQSAQDVVCGVSQAPAPHSGTPWLHSHAPIHPHQCSYLWFFPALLWAQALEVPALEPRLQAVRFAAQFEGRAAWLRSGSALLAQVGGALLAQVEALSGMAGCH